MDPSISSLGYDTTFELDSFSRPRLRSAAELVKNILLFILFTKPGQYPSLPHIGLDIQSMLFSFYDEISDVGLRDQIVSQCQALGVCFDVGVVNVRKTIYRGKPSLMIHIETDPTDSQMMNYMDYTSEGNDSRYQIGITFDELDKMIYNISHGRGM